MVDQDPYVRALWELAHRHINSMGESVGITDVPADAPSVLKLRDLLVHAWESGAKRTLAQAAAIDECLVRAAGLAPPLTIHILPCSSCGALPESL